MNNPKKNEMTTKVDNPGVYIPPPLIYAATFFLSILIQYYFPLSIPFFHSSAATIAGIGCVLTGMFFAFPALLTFLKTKNTLITIKPATSLQTSGIYSFTRNPMYLGLLLLYTGIAFLKGNWWTIIFIPLVLLLVTFFVIRNEEHYFFRAFGQDYAAYKKKSEDGYKKNF